MKGARFLILVLALLALASVPTAAAPLSDPCPPGTAFHPACDVDDNGVINIDDIMRTASRWLTSGPAISDNNHTHLGQTWTGTNQPLKLTGSYGDPDYAPLVLSNSTANGAGLRVSSAGKYGVSVGSAGNPSSTTASDLPSGLMVSGSQGHGLWVGRSDHNGVHVYSAGSAGVQVDQAASEGLRAVVAGDDGVQVDFAGNPSSWTYSSAKNGVEVAGAQGYGLFVGRADLDGVYVNSTAWHGINVSGAGVDGVYVSSPGDDGVEIHSAGNDGVHVVSPAHYGVLIEGGLGGILVQETTGFAGYFYGDIVVTGTCYNCRIAQLGVNSGKAPLATGDVVAVTGVGANPLVVDNVLFEVKAATAGEPLIGVVTGKVEILTSPEDGTANLVRRDGMVAQPGDYVSIVTYGPVQVKATGDVLLGDRVAVDETGSLRAMRRVQVEGVTLDEGGASLGLALDTAKDGMVWVLVNPQ